MAEGVKPEVVFEERHEERGELCSEHVCLQKHVWMPTVKLAQCGGCRGPVVAIKMENCPICNEPAVYTRLRIDHIGYKQPLHAICRGVATNAEVVMAEMKRSHWEGMEKEGPDLPVGQEPAHRWNIGELNRRISCEITEAKSGDRGGDLSRVEVETGEGTPKTDGGDDVDGCSGGESVDVH